MEDYQRELMFGVLMLVIGIIFFVLSLKDTGRPNGSVGLVISAITAVGVGIYKIIEFFSL